MRSITYWFIGGCLCVSLMLLGYTLTAIGVMALFSTMGIIADTYPLLGRYIFLQYIYNPTPFVSRVVGRRVGSNSRYWKVNNLKVAIETLKLKNIDGYSISIYDRSERVCVSITYTYILGWSTSITGDVEGYANRELAIIPVNSHDPQVAINKTITKLSELLRDGVIKK